MEKEKLLDFVRLEEKGGHSSFSSSLVLAMRQQAEFNQCWDAVPNDSTRSVAGCSARASKRRMSPISAQSEAIAMWEERRFHGEWEYRQFVQYIESLVESGEAEEVEVDLHFVWYGKERWFRNRASGEVWTLFPDDGPLRAGWTRVDWSRRHRLG
jgi:hypothetical protein